jgi:hypothetical protein
MSVKTRTVKAGAHLAVPLQDAVTEWLNAHAHQPTKKAAVTLRRAVSKGRNAR